jgi:hypothetical protein
MFRREAIEYPSLSLNSLPSGDEDKSSAVGSSTSTNAVAASITNHRSLLGMKLSVTRPFLLPLLGTMLVRPKRGKLKLGDTDADDTES